MLASGGGRGLGKRHTSDLHVYQPLYLVGAKTEAFKQAVRAGWRGPLRVRDKATCIDHRPISMPTITHLCH